MDQNPFQVFSGKKLSQAENEREIMPKDASKKLCLKLHLTQTKLFKLIDEQKFRLRHVLSDFHCYCHHWDLTFFIIPFLIQVLHAHEEDYFFYAFSFR